MKRFIKFYNNLKFANRMAISFITLTLTAFVLFSFVIGIVFLNKSRDTALSHNKQISMQLSDTLNIYFDSFNKMADMLAKNTIEYGLNSNTEHMLNQILSAYPEIAGLLIVDTKENYAMAGMERVSRNSFVNEHWYNIALEAKGKTVILGDFITRNVSPINNYTLDTVFTLCKAVYNNNKLVAVLLIDVRHDVVQKSINNLKIGDNGFVFILDKNDAVIYAPVNSLVFRIDPKWFKDKKEFIKTIYGQQYQITAINNQSTGWLVVGVVPLKEAQKGINTLLALLLIAVITISILILVGSIYLSRSITKPIDKLQKLMLMAESGNLSVRFNSKYNDEIGGLGNSFNHMLGRIELLIAQVIREQNLKQEAQMRSLQEQIKPHFLYNTLDNISWMARDHQAYNVVKLVDALTAMFRVGLNRGRDTNTIKDEQTHISNYLYILKIRYGENLNYNIDIDDDILNFVVPKLILQPLVENAVYHGIKQKQGGGFISVQGYKENEYIVLCVVDNGAGMNKSKLDQVVYKISGKQENSNEGFGLYYVGQCLKNYFGNKYLVKAYSNIGEGTSIKLFLPKGEHNV